MFGSVILDIAIGLAFLYLLLSFVVTAANEFIAAQLGWRAESLYEGISELLRDPTDKNGWAAKLYAHPLINSLSPGAKRPSYIPSRTFALALLDHIAEAKENRPRTLADIQKGIARLPPDLRRTMTVLLDEADHDVEKLKTGFEVWFNGSMERVSGWYKRKSHFLLLGLAAAVTILMNVDTLNVVRALSNDASLRAALVAQAQVQAKAEPSASVDLGATLSKTDQLKSLGLPIGWKQRLTAEELQNGPAILWLNRVCGWALTIFAVSLGAPFWFDLLNRFMNIRAAGKAPEEEPKKPKEFPHPLPPGTPVAPERTRVAAVIT